MTERRPGVQISNKATFRGLAIAFLAGAICGAAVLWGLGRGEGVAKQTIDELRATNQELQSALSAAEAGGRQLAGILDGLSGIAESLEAANEAASGGIEESFLHLGLIESLLGELETLIRNTGLLD